MIKYIISGFFITILISSCANKVDGVRMDEELEPYFIIFEEEAAKRGVVFDNSIEQIEAYLQNIADSGVIGACQRNENNDNNRAIFFDEPYWLTATDTEREYVVFHELGHCFLLLGHDDNENEKGECISIMASGLGSCRDNYNSNTRDELLDELFSK